MTYSIVYSSRTGNTKLLADIISETIGSAHDCIYFGEADDKALEAEIIFAGFWTDKGTSDEKSSAFLRLLRNKKVFIFGTAGFGTDPEYFNLVLSRVKKNLHSSNSLIGTYMCQGKMPLTVRQVYEKKRDSGDPPENVDMLIRNFDLALGHPDETDIRHLAEAVEKII